MPPDHKAGTHPNWRIPLRAVDFLARGLTVRAAGFDGFHALSTDDRGTEREMATYALAIPLGGEQAFGTGNNE